MDELDDLLLGKKPKKPVKPTVSPQGTGTPADTYTPRVVIHRPAVESDQSFRDFFKKQGFKVNRTFGRAINAGSPHTYGGAADIGIHGKSASDIYRLMESALLRGYRVFDERVAAPGVKQTGPHIHVENAKTRLTKRSRFVNQGFTREQMARLQELDNIRLGRKSVDPLDSFLTNGTGGDGSVLAPQTYLPPVDVPEVNMSGGEAVPLQMATPETVAKLGVVPATDNNIAALSQSAPQVETPPVPETPDTLASQRAAMNDPASTRIGVQYTAGTNPGLRAKNETDIKLADGSTLRVNTDKYTRHAFQNGLKRADIETGVADVTQFLGGKADPSVDTANKPTVVTRDRKIGTELVASTVESPESVPVEAGLQKDQFPAADTETVVTTSNAVTGDRVNGEAPSDGDYQQYVEFERSQGKEPMPFDQFAAAVNESTATVNTDANLNDQPAWNAEIDRQNQQAELTPDLVEAKTDEEIISKGAAGTFEIDLATKPKGENTGRFLVRSALEQLAPEYGFSHGDINRAVNFLRDTNGRYTQKGDDITDEDIEEAKANTGSAVSPFTVTNSLLNWMLNRRDGIEGDGLNAALKERVAMANAQMEKGPAVSKRDFGQETEAVAEEKLTKRIGEWDYAAQQVAANRLGEATSDPLFYIAPWAFAGKQAYKDLTDPVVVDDDWIKEEKDRLLKQYSPDGTAKSGSYSKAWTAEQMYQNADLLEKGVRIANQTGRSFLKNVVSATGKGVVFAGQLLENLLKTPNPLTGVLPLNKFLPDHLQIGTRNAGNALDLFTRFLTAPDSQTALNDWRRTYVAGDAPIKDQQLFKAMQAFDDAVGDDPMLKGRLLGQLADAQGSALAFMATGLLTPELSVSTKLGQFGIAPAAWGALSQAGTGYEEGTRSGLTEEQARQYGVIQGILGLTEGFGIGGQAGHLIKDPIVRGRLAEGILDVAKKGILREGGEEFLQELVQTTGGKAALEYLKDKDPSAYQKVINLFKRLPKQVTQTVTNEGLIAFATGGLTGAAGRAAQIGMQDKPETDETPRQYERQIDADIFSGDKGLAKNEADTKRIFTDKSGNRLSYVRDADQAGKIIVADEKGRETLRNKDRLTPVEFKDADLAENEANNTVNTTNKEVSNDADITGLEPEKEAVLRELAGAKTDTTEAVATDAAHDAATSPHNDLPEPTQAQKEAGNYKKGHININGLDISVENPVGSERKGVDRDGKAWSVKMNQHYGYIKRTIGADEEQVDVFVKDGTAADFAGDVFVVDQVHPDTGKFDEHKVMLGFDSEQEAREAYAANYAKDWKGLKSITKMEMPLFKAWLSQPVEEPSAKTFPSDEPTAAAGTKRRPFFGEAESDSMPRREFFSKADKSANDRPAYELSKEEFDAKYPDEKDGGTVKGRDGNTYNVDQGVKGKWITRGTENGRTRVFKNKKDMREFLHGDATHKRAVGKAVRDGKTVSPEILSLYPEIERRVNKDSADRIFRFQADERVSEVLGNVTTHGLAAPANIRLGIEDLRDIAKKHDVSETEIQRLLSNADTAFRRRKDRGAGTREEGSRPAPKKTLQGKAVSVDIAGSDKSYKAEYELREASDLHASHNPFNFNPNEEYFYKNDRHYDKGGEYAANVIQRSMPNKFKPSEVVNNAPTAELGAPVVDIDGNVLGGNSRAMMIARIYGSENSKARDNYLAKLRDDAPAFGFAADDISKFDHPVLVRKIVDRGYDKQTAITDLNKVSVTNLTQSEQAIAEGGNLTPEAMQFIIAKARLSGSDASISDVLTRHGADIVDELLKENIFSQGERNSLLKDGEITAAGKERITKMLVGHVFEDLEQMQYLPDGYRNAVQRAVIPLIKTENDEAWTLVPATREALDLLTEHQAKGGKQAIDIFAGQASALKPEGWSPKSISIAKTIKAGTSSTADAFNVYAGEYRNADEGSMFGALTPDEAFAEAFNSQRNKPLAKRSDASVPAFYSQAEKVIEEKMPNKAPALMVRNLLSPKNGVKQEEIDWLGVNEWLQDNPNPTKDEVLEFIRLNNVGVEEVEKGSREIPVFSTEEFNKYVDKLAEKYGVDLDQDGISNFDALKELETRVTPEESREWMRLEDATVGIEDNTKYGAYTLPGGKNYRELLLTLPITPVKKTYEEWLKENFTGEDSEHARELYKIQQEPGTGFASRHWAEPNVLGHVRFDDRDGGKTLHIAEIQSDWHQKGRDKGYKTGAPAAITLDAIESREFGYHVTFSDGSVSDVGKGTIGYNASDEDVRNYYKNILREKNELLKRKEVSKVPDAPFKKSWHELAMKRMIRYAAENGYERITWDTGTTQNDRYDLSKQIDSVKWRKISADGYKVEVYKDGSDISDSIKLPSVGSKAQLQELLGKDVAEKITASTESSGTLAGENLKITGTGMTGFYDKILRAFVNKYVKKFDSKVESGVIKDIRSKGDIFQHVERDAASGRYVVILWGGKKWGSFESEDQAIKEYQNEFKPDGVPVHSLTITPAMIDSVITKGQPLYKIRDDAGSELLYKILPKASHATVLGGMSGGRFNETNDLELNEYDAEMLKRLVEETNFYRFGHEEKESSFEGVTIETEDLRMISDVARDLAKQLAAGNYSDTIINTYNELVANLEKLADLSDKAGVAYVFDDALPEEKFHQEELNAGRTDRIAIRELIKSLFWNFGGKFEELYAGLSDADKASEIAAKLYTGQSADFGWDKVPDFETKKNEFLATFLDGILRRNSDTIADVGAEQFLERFERLRTLYAKTQTTNSGRSSEGDRGQSFDRSSSRPDGRERDDRSETERTEAVGVGNSPRESEDPSGILPAAQKESLKQEKEEADGLGVSPEEVRAKNRQFAATLRENGRDATDVPYIPGSDDERITEVKQILQESRDKADNAVFPYGDYEHAIDIFENPETDGRTKTALGIALIDHLGAAGEYTQMLRVAEMVTNHVGEAAQALQAATLVSKYDFAGGVRLAQKALERNGKKLTDEEIDEIRRLTDLYARSEEQRALLEGVTTVLQDNIRSLKTENAEIAEALGEQVDTIGEQNKLIKNLKLQVERWKNGALQRSNSGAKISKAHQELVDRRGAIVARLTEKFPQAKGILKSTTETGDDVVSVTPTTFDDETRKSLVELTALNIFDGLAFSKVIDQIEKITGGVLTDEEIRSVHADAVDMTRGESTAPSAEVLTRIKLKHEHRAEADKFRNKKVTGGSRLFKNPNLNRLDREILHLAAGDNELGVGTVLLNQVRTKEAWYDSIGKFYPELKDKAKDKLFTRSWKLKTDARESLDKIRTENARDLKLTEQEYEQIKHERYIARGIAAKKRKALDAHYKDLQKTMAERVADIVLDIASLPKTTMSGGEVSYILRQGYLPFVLFTRDGVAGLEGVARGMQSEETRLVYQEKLRERPRFKESQVFGVEYGEIGDYPVTDEHFTSRIFEKGEKLENETVNRLVGAGAGAAIGTIFGGPVGTAIGTGVGAAIGARGISKAQRRFEFAYTLPGDAQRLFLYERMAAQIDGNNLTAPQAKEAKQFAAKIANRLTGRGDIRGIFNPGGYFGKLLNAIGFSPKLVASRFQSGFWLSPVSLPFVPKGMRMMMAKKQARFNATMLTIAAAFAMVLDAPDDDDERSSWDVFDPASKHFMKGRIRGTDYKFDLTANMSEPMRLFMFNAIGSGYYAATGQWNKLNDIWKQEYERYIVTEQGSPLRFFQGKLSPTASYVLDAAKGKDFLGRDFDPWTGAKQRLWPLTYQQAYQGLIYDPYESAMREPMKDQADASWERLKNNQTDWRKMLAILIPSAIGMNIQQYAETEQSRAEQKAWDMWERGFPDKKTDQEKRVGSGIRKLYRMRQEMERDGVDVGAVDRAILSYALKYKVDTADLNKLKSQATGSRFEFATENFSTEQVRVLIDEYATEKEKAELQKILDAKIAKENRPIAEKLKSASTDDAVKKFKTGNLSEADQAELKKILVRKAQNAADGGTLTADEIENIKTVIPDFNMKPSAPKMIKPKKPVAPLP